MPNKFFSIAVLALIGTIKAVKLTNDDLWNDDEDT